MKKVIFATMLLVTAFAVNAQVKVYKLESTGTNEAYTVPEYIRMDFQSAYPAITVVEWDPVVTINEPVTTMWRASYKENNRISQVFYNPNGVNYRVSLPVINSYVPEEVITSAINLYGSELYSITRMKSAANGEVYQVRLLDTEPRMVWMDPVGTVVSEKEVYKIKIDEDGMKIKSEDAKMKIKSDNL